MKKYVFLAVILAALCVSVAHANLTINGFDAGSGDGGGVLFEGKTIATLSVTDGVATVEAGGVYQCGGLPGGTEINLLGDSDGNYTEFNDNDTVSIIMNSPNVTVMMRENPYITSKSYANYTGSVLAPVLVFQFLSDPDNDPGTNDEAWQCINLAPGEKSVGEQAVNNINVGAGSIRGSDKVFGSDDIDDEAGDIWLNYNLHNQAIIRLDGTAGGRDIGVWDCKAETLGSKWNVFTGAVASADSIYPWVDSNDEIYLKNAISGIGPGEKAVLPTDGYEFYSGECIAVDKWIITRSDGTITDGGNPTLDCYTCDEDFPSATLCYDGNYAGDATMVNLASGDAVGTFTTGVISTLDTYCSSANILLFDDTADAAELPGGSTNIPTDQYTIHILLKTPAEWTNSDYLFRYTVDLQNRIYASRQSDGTILVNHEANDVSVSFTTDAVILNDQLNYIRILDQQLLEL